MATFDSFDDLRRRRAAENPAAPALSDANTTLERADLDAIFVAGGLDPPAGHVSHSARRGFLCYDCGATFATAGAIPLFVVLSVTRARSAGRPRMRSTTRRAFCADTRT